MAPRVVLGLMIAACAAAQVRPDTERLAKLLQPFRGHKVYELQPAEYNGIQKDLLAWIDTRLREGKGGSAMTAELEAAGLLSDGPQNIDDYDKSYAGFLGSVSTSPISEAPELLEVTFDILTGGYCNDDTTVALYTRSPFRRIAVLNAEPMYSHGSLLRTVTVGKPDRTDRRIVATAWVASNCTSNWNGENFRIDRLAGTALTPVANQRIGAYFGDPVKITLGEGTATVQYTTQDSQANFIPVVEHYRIDGGHLTLSSNPPP